MQRPENSILANYYSGLSGLVLPVPKYLFPDAYREASRLTYYASFFNSIEINSTFYKLPMPATVIKWAQQVPEGFKFTFKLWQEITHTEHLSFNELQVQQFFQVISGTGKKGCVLVQFPPSLGVAHLRQLEALMHCISIYNTNHDWKVAVEFRNRSWYQQDVYDLLKEKNAAMVIQDIPKSVSPIISTTDFIYLRFHGPTGNYRDSYAEAVLAEYATFINEWLAEGKIVYTYFNNTAGDAFQNLETLNRFVYA